MEGWLVAIVIVIVIVVWANTSDADDLRRREAAEQARLGAEKRRHEAKQLEAEARERQRDENRARLEAAIADDLAAELRARAAGTYVTDYLTAEVAMERAMARFLGFTSARCTGAGADEGIDIVAKGALAQVKYQKAKVARPDVQRLVGARHTRPDQGDARLLFFAFGEAPYSKPALDFADGADVALFSYNASGEIFPVNAVAAAMPVRDSQAAARANAAWKAREALRAERSRKTRSGDKCPCGGQFVVRRRKRDNKKFFGCSNYPRCVETRSA